ncbi:SGNH/GDSL hydrolase family protein [Nocardia takedensis]|uniref:SGNH/GDSL hydrolase family protein n=1 Tax=Nocardia takedensis TaxID=259390 RepID=UPI0002F105F9|nr:SGNH/GDSL hydrolase family protein [Nocardia takedensis]
MALYRSATPRLTAGRGEGSARVSNARELRGTRYVALGSSYAAGPGILPVSDVGCGRSGRNYPHQLAAALELDLVDVSSAGATTAEVIDRPQRLPCGTVVPPQLRAVTAETRLVTVTIGGNDLGMIGGLLARSRGRLVTSGRARPPEDRVAGGVDAFRTAAEFAAVERSITEIVRRVRAEAPHARVLLVEYLPILPASGPLRHDIPLTVRDAVHHRHIYAGLLAATRAAADATGADAVRVPGAENHTICTPVPWVHGYGDNPDVTAYHPTLAGMTAVAHHLIRFLTRG